MQSFLVPKCASWRPEMSNANAAAKAFGLSLLFTLLLICQSLVSAPLPSLHITLHTCFSHPGDITLTGVTHFQHLHWVLCAAATLCLSESPAAQRPHCVSHNKVFKFGVAACLRLCLTPKIPNISTPSWITRHALTVDLYLMWCKWILNCDLQRIT